MKKTAKKGLIFLMAILILLVGCQKEEKADVSEKEIPVEVLEAKASTYDERITVPGVVASDEEITYSFKMEGKIAKILVESGQTVKKGDVLARLDEEDYKKLLEISRLQVKSAKAGYDNAQNALVKAKANHDQAKKDYEKIAVLYKEGSISKTEYEAAELRFDIAKEDYKTSRGGAIDLAKSNYEKVLTNHDIKKDQFANGEIKSNFDGYVKTVYVKEGNQTDKNEPIVAVASTNAQVAIGLSSEEKQNIRIGDRVEIIYGDKNIEGQIKSISDVLDSNTLLYRIEIAIPQNDIPSYSIVKVNAKIGEQRGVKIPIKAVLNDGLPFVFVAEEDHAVKRQVSIIGYDKEHVLIEGIEDNAKIITIGNKVLRGGERVITGHLTN